MVLCRPFCLQYVVLVSPVQFSATTQNALDLCSKVLLYRCCFISPLPQNTHTMVLLSFCGRRLCQSIVSFFGRFLSPTDSWNFHTSVQPRIYWFPLGNSRATLLYNIYFITLTSASNSSCHTWLKCLVPRSELPLGTRLPNFTSRRTLRASFFKRLRIFFVCKKIAPSLAQLTQKHISLKALAALSELPPGTRLPLLYLSENLAGVLLRILAGSFSFFENHTPLSSAHTKSKTKYSTLISTLFFGESIGLHMSFHSSILS